MRRSLAITLALFALLFVLALLRYAPPSPAPRSAPPDRFSAERARAVQARVVGDGASRYAGTPGNARGRAAIVDELGAAGWTVETPRAMACTYHGMCAWVTNVVAVLPGREPRASAVLMSAHYDSVPAGPGASDDGAGTATVIEAARAIAAGARPYRTVIALLTDGEEAGLLGAEAFVAEHPRAKAIAFTVNVDARGSRGPSQMFETSGGNGWLVAMMAGHLSRPVTTSLFYEVYKRLPNDTDFSITKTIAAGVNFANTAGIEDYHTPLDTLAVADIGTLQHHGDHVLEMTRAFAETERLPGADAHADAVWFDVMALGIVRVPARFTVFLAVLALALVLGQAFRARAWGIGLAVFVPAIAAGAAAAFAAGWIAKTAGAVPALWTAHPLPVLFALAVAALAALAAIVRPFAARGTPASLWAGTWIGWGVAGVAVAGAAPGIAYLFVVPTLVAALARVLRPAIAPILPAAAAATLVFPLALALYDGLGFAVMPLLAFPAIVLGTTVVPLLAGEERLVGRLAALLAAGSIAGIVVAVVSPKFSAERPQRVNVVFRQDEEGKEARARVFVDTTWGPSRWGSAPAAMTAVFDASPAAAAALPWMSASLAWPTPAIAALPPTAEVLALDTGARRHVRARLRSSRGASILAIQWAAKPRIEMKVEGRRVFPRWVGAAYVAGILTVPEEGVVVDFEGEGQAPFAITVFDRTPGVPPGTKAEAAVRARPALAVPTQDGDSTVFTKTLSL